MSDERPGWTGNHRTAGDITVQDAGGGKFIAIPADGRPALRACPCCGALMRTADAAKRVADWVYPAA